jgi:ADP-ribose pyrophosphatase
MGSTDRFRPWEVLGSREVFVAEPWIKVSVQQVRLPNGRIVDNYHRIEFPEYVVVFAQTGDGEVVLERSYKHGVGHSSLVLPSGLIDEGEEPLAAARRELLEETGYAASEWRLLGSFVPNGNYGCGKAHLFTAREAHQVAQPDSGDLEDMDIIRMKPDELVGAVQRGDIALLGSIAAIALALNPLFSPTDDGSSSADSLQV